MVSGSPNPFGLLVLYGWPLIAIALFTFLPPKRALVAGLVIGWLFLPANYAGDTPFVKWDKHAATSFGALLGAMIFDTPNLRKYRFSWMDIPLIVWCLCPYPAALGNDLTAYDGAAAVAKEFVVWGIPYYLGRAYFSDIVGIRGLAVWLFVAGLIYAPLCLYEVRLSPQLHNKIYGYYQHDFAQNIRLGGFRPVVFLQHGLAVGMLMTAASLAGIWLWWTKSLVAVRKVPMWVLLGGLLFATLVTKSSGALALLAVGVGVLFLTRWLHTYVLLFALVASPIVYMYARGAGIWEGKNVVSLIDRYVQAQRAESLAFRFENETLLLARAAQRPVFGWGPNDNFLVKRPDGTIESVPDGFWVIALGTVGRVGLIAIYTAMLLPLLLLPRRVRAGDLDAPLLAGVGIVALIIVLHSIDNLMNAMLNPLFIISLGGLTGIVADPRSINIPEEILLRRPGRRWFWFIRRRPAAAPVAVRAPDPEILFEPPPADGLDPLVIPKPKPRPDPDDKPGKTKPGVKVPPDDDNDKDPLDEELGIH